MVAAGISEATIKDAKLNSRQSWTFIDDPADKRRVLIEFDSLKDRYKQAITDKFGDPHAYIRQSALKQLIQKDAVALNFYRQHKLADGRSLPDQAILDYTKAAQWLNMLSLFSSSLVAAKRTLKGLGMASRRDFYDACVAIIKAEGVDLPANYSRLMEKLRTYEQHGYATLISKKYGNANSQKITAEAGEWLCAFYGNPFPKATIEQTWMKYNATATINGWEALEHHNTVYQYLYRPEVERKWYGLREGWNKFKEKYGIQAKNERASRRDSLWFADGTGLNFYSKEADRQKMEKMQRVYWVNDDHSEVILGWDIAPSENEKSVYRAFKAAVNFSGHKPYEVRYDQSSANIKIGPFIENIAAKLHFPCEAYNGKSKSIEPITLRFQAQIMKHWFFFSGQNRGSRADRSVANMEAILEVRKLLPDFETMCKVFAECVKEWNNAPHPKIAGKSRLEVYLSSQNDEATPFTAFDAVEAFWNTTRLPITYNAAGILLTLGKAKHLYEVYGDDGEIDLDFRKKYIGAKFIVRYDPDDMSQAWLYDRTASGALQLVAAAENTDTHRFHIATQDHTPGEASRIRTFQSIRRKDNKEAKDEARAMAEKYEMLPVQVATKQKKKYEELTMATHYRDDDNYQRVSLYGNNSGVNEMEDAE
jgi:hypothetical protein